MCFDSGPCREQNSSPMRALVWLLLGLLALGACASRPAQETSSPTQSRPWVCEPDSGDSGWWCRRGAAETGTIGDGDPPTVSLILTPDTIAETGGVSAVTATLDHPSSTNTRVTVSAAPMLPATTRDYRLSRNRVLTILAGAQTSTGLVTVTAVDNSVKTPDKTLTVSATAANTQGVTNPAALTLTITDDDDARTPSPPPVLAIADASATEGDADGTTLAFRVTLAPAATQTVTVDWKTANGTATAGTDYRAGSGSLTFNAGDSSRTVTVAVMGDDANEPDETFTVMLSNESGATLGDAAGTGMIRDDDARPRAPTLPRVMLVLTPDRITETGGVSVVTAILDHPSGEDTTVTVSAGDYSLSGNAVLTIAAGEKTSTGVVTVTAVDNDARGADKRVAVSGFAFNSRGVAGPDDVMLTITDDDGGTPTLPVLSIDDPSAFEGNAGATTLAFTVTLAPAATQTVMVDWATADGTAEAGTDYRAGSGSLMFNAGESSKTVTVTVMGDDLEEPDETFAVTLSNGSGATLGDVAGIGTIKDDDNMPTVTLHLDRNSITEAGGVSRVRAHLNRPSSGATTIVVSAAPVSPTVSGDYRLGANRELTIPAGGTESTDAVTITAVDNQATAPDKLVAVSGFAFNLRGIAGPDDVTLTIMDDDGDASALPELLIDDPSVLEGVAGGMWDKSPGDSSKEPLHESREPRGA